MESFHNRKISTVFFFIGLIMTLVLSVSVQAQTKMQMSLGGMKGSNYMIGAQVAKYINEQSKKLSITPITSGGTVENLRRVNQGTAQLGMASVAGQYQSWSGTSPFKQKMTNWRIIGVGSKTLLLHVVSLAKSNIRVPEDLKGKTVALGAAGSSAARELQKFFDHIGLSKDINARMISHKEAPTLLRDGKIDAFNRKGSVPVSVIQELAVQQKIAVLDMGEAVDKSGYLKENPFYEKVVVKGGTYKGVDRDVTLIGNAGFFIANKNVSDDVVYEFTKLAYSDECIRIVGLGFKGHNINRTNPPSGNIAPIHPGAAKFWREIGVKIPETLLK